MRFSVLLPALVFSTLGIQALPAQSSQDKALHEAVDHGDLAGVTAAINQGAKVNAGTGPYHFTPLMDAASGGHVDVLHYLLAHGAAIDQGDSQGSTALLHACNENETEAALALLQAGANPNVGSHFKRFPLMFAAQKGNDTIVSALLAAKANVNANCNNGTAAYWAVLGNHPSTLKLLLDAGADPHLAPAGFKPIPDSLLGDAASVNSPEMIDLLLAHGCDVNAVSSDGKTPLMFAAQDIAPDAISRLFVKGAQVDTRDPQGRTALMFATVYGTEGVKAVDALIDAHANLEIKDNEGRTPLMEACARAKEEIALHLVNHGADVNAIDNKGETALTYAGNIGQVNLVDLLKQHGATRISVHIIAKPMPAQPLPVPHAWALAVSGMYTQYFNQNHNFLGGAPENASFAQTMLRNYWGITDRASLLQQVESLRTEGHRAGYQKKGHELCDMPSDAFQKYLAAQPEEAANRKAMRESYLVWKDRSGLAWDLCRAAMLVNQGVGAGYLHANEAWPLLMDISRQVQGGFSSWKEMSDNFLDGREVWDHKHDPHMIACANLLLDPNEPNSPWNHLPWKTNLTGS